MCLEVSGSEMGRVRSTAVRIPGRKSEPLFVDAFIDMSSEAAGRMIFGSHRGETRMRERERELLLKATPSTDPLHPHQLTRGDRLKRVGPRVVEGTKAHPASQCAVTQASVVLQCKTQCAIDSLSSEVTQI